MQSGVAAHIVQRGVNRQDCFNEEADYLVYLSILRESLVSTGCVLHAYCLMTNHVHLLLTPPDALGCSKVMHEIGQRYVPYFNRRHQRSGTLWEGRFRSCLVDSPEYVLACHRYIELNPVRAAMVDMPSAYRWSSHLGNSGQRDDPLLTAHPEYAALGRDAGSRRAAYRALCETEESEKFLATVRDATNSGIPLAGESLRLELAMKGARVERGKPGPRTQSPPEPGLASGELDL